MNRLILNAFFPGEPISWKRAGGHGRHRFNPKFMENAKKKLRRQLKMIVPTLKPTDERFGVQMVFKIPFAKRVDGDNLEKLVFDALKGVIWNDDEQIDEWQGKKARLISGHCELGIHLVVYVIE